MSDELYVARKKKHNFHDGKVRPSGLASTHIACATCIVIYNNNNITNGPTSQLSQCYYFI